VFLLAATLLAVSLAPSALAQSAPYGQCGGIGFSGSTTCTSGWTCTYSNPYYSQCLPGGASSSSTVKPTSTSTTTTSKGTTTPPGTTTTTSTTAGSPPPSTTSSGSPAGSSTWPTLLPNQLWVRADEAPYFHYYLQSETLNSPGKAVLGSTSTAGQFQVVTGQLVQYTPYGNQLYGSVYPPVTGTKRMQLFWQTSPATNVTWTFSGDALTASIPGYTQAQGGIWLACTDDSTTRLAVYVNLGNFDYQTPTGCGDETLNYYNGPTPVSK